MTSKLLVVEKSVGERLLAGGYAEYIKKTAADKVKERAANALLDHLLQPGRYTVEAKIEWHGNTCSLRALVRPARSTEPAPTREEMAGVPALRLVGMVTKELMRRVPVVTRVRLPAAFRSAWVAAFPWDA